MTESMWTLPGPRGYVAEIAASVTRGRHVVAVLPEFVATTDVTVALADAIVEELDDGAHVAIGEGGPLVEQVCSDVPDDYEMHPASIHELLAWDSPRARAFVVNAMEIPDARRAELRTFLAGLAHESRVAADAKVHFVVISRDFDLPDSLSPDGDVTVATRWFWNRVARWDTVAHVAAIDGGTETDTLIDEIRIETIVELARWNLSLATELATSWTSSVVPDLGSLGWTSSGTADSVALDAVRPVRVGSWPSARLVEAWNCGAVAGWRGRVSVAPMAPGYGDRQVERHVWAAQARVLLPFIDAKRERLESHLRQELGSARFDREVALRTIVPSTTNHVQAPVPEVALLREVARCARRDERRTKSLIALRDARNRLSHLVPLTSAEIVELEKSCLWLG